MVEEAIEEYRVETVPAVVEERLKYALPDEVKLVLEALAKVVCPATFNVPVKVRPVPEAVVKYVCPETVREVAEAVARTD